MGFIDNIKALFNQPAAPAIVYGTTKDWFASEKGRKTLDQAKTVVELTDFTFHYLKATLANKKLLEDDDLYRLAFVLSDGVVNSNQPYAGKEMIMDATTNPFIAYLQKVTRNLAPRFLCIELILILFGAADPFDANSWLYDTNRKGYSIEEYIDIAKQHGLSLPELLKVEYIGREDLRAIMCELVWIVSDDALLKAIA